MIRGDGRDPAPIIDPRRDQPRIDARRQVGRRLDVHRRAEDQARRGEAPKQVVEIRLRGAGELGAGLGAEVLDDDFLNMPETAMQIADGEQRLQALGARLADTDQNAGRERHAQLARQPQRLKTRLGPLIGRTVVNSARFAEPRAERFQHDALAGRDRPQAGDLGPAHDSGIGVRQQSGLAQHQRAHRLEIIDRGLVSERVQRLPGGAVAQLRLVAEREKRLRAAGGGSGAGDGEHLVRGQIGRPSRARPLGEGAIMADIPAQMGERNEHLARIRDMAAMPLVAQASRRVDQLRERGLFEPDQKRVIAQIAHRNHLMRLFGMVRVTLDADRE